MQHHTNSHNTDQGSGIGADDSRHEFESLLLDYFKQVDIQDIYKSLKYIHKLAMYHTVELSFTIDDRFNFQLIDELIELLEEEAHHA